MIISLLSKEFHISSDRSISLVYKILSWLFKVLLLAGEIALTCFMVRTLDNKITNYSPTNGSLDFLVILLFIIFVAFVFFGLIRLRKSLYDSRDTYILSTLPIYEDKIIIVKTLKCFLSMGVDALFIYLPILITYGANRSMSASYFVIFTWAYPFIVSLVAIGIDLLLVSAYEFLYRFLKNKEILQFILASILMIGLCYLYKIFMELFLNCLSDSSIGNVFSDGFISSVNKIGKYLLPVSNLIYPMFTGNNALSYLIILLGFILLICFFSYIIATYCYTYLSKTDSISFNGFSSKKEATSSVNIALIKKELNLIFRDSSSIFSYTSLLIMMPFLTYVVVSAFNNIVFSDLGTIAALYPYLDDSIIRCLIILFISTVNSSSSMIAKEKKNIATIKMLPISPIKMVLIKAIVPLCLSFFSLIATTITLFASGCISLELFLFSSLSGLLYVVATTFLGLKIEMYDRGSHKNKLDSLYYYFCLLLPIFLLSLDLLIDLFRLSHFIAYTINLGTYLLILLFAFLFYKKRIYKSFNNMEINKI